MGGSLRSDAFAGMCETRPVAKHEFLSDEWFAIVDQLVAEHGAETPDGADIVMNLVVVDTPFGAERHLHLGARGGRAHYGIGHAPDADVTLTTDYATAKEIFVSGDPQAGMAAFFAGKVQDPGGSREADDHAGGGRRTREHERARRSRAGDHELTERSRSSTSTATITETGLAAALTSCSGSNDGGRSRRCAPRRAGAADGAAVAAQGPGHPGAAGGPVREPVDRIHGWVLVLAFTRTRQLNGSDVTRNRRSPTRARPAYCGATALGRSLVVGSSLGAASIELLDRPPVLAVGDLVGERPGLEQRDRVALHEECLTGERAVGRRQVGDERATRSPGPTTSNVAASSGTFTTSLEAGRRPR